VDEEARQVNLHAIVGEILVAKCFTGGLADSVGGDGSQETVFLEWAVFRQDVSVLGAAACQQNLGFRAFLSSGIQKVKGACEVCLVGVVLAAPGDAVKGLGCHVDNDVRLQVLKQVSQASPVEYVAFVVAMVEDWALATVRGGTRQAKGLPAFFFTRAYKMTPDHSR